MKQEKTHKTQYDLVNVAILSQYLYLIIFIVHILLYYR